MTTDTVQRGLKWHAFATIVLKSPVQTWTLWKRHLTHERIMKMAVAAWPSESISVMPGVCRLDLRNQCLCSLDLLWAVGCQHPGRRTHVEYVWIWEPRTEPHSSECVSKWRNEGVNKWMSELSSWWAVFLLLLLFLEQIGVASILGCFGNHFSLPRSLPT